MLGDARARGGHRCPRMPSTATTSASGCRPSPRSRATTSRRPWRARARTAGARSRGSSARSRRGGVRRACATPRCSRAWRVSRRTPSPSWRRSRPARRSGSWSASCIPRDVEQPLDARISGSVMHNALRLFFNGVPSELARPAAAPRAPAGGVRPARSLHRRGDRDPGLRGRRRRLGGAAARAAPQPAHGRARRGGAASTSSSRATSRSRSPRAACASAMWRSRAASTASTSASGSPRR